jgi:hypothetical protein
MGNAPRQTRGNLHLLKIVSKRVVLLHSCAVAIAQYSTTIETTDNASPAPADHDGSDGADHHCAICALMHLAAAVALAEPPSIPLPLALGRWRPDATVKFGWIASPFPFFSARAPPVA